MISSLSSRTGISPDTVTPSAPGETRSNGALRSLVPPAAATLLPLVLTLLVARDMKAQTDFREPSGARFLPVVFTSAADDFRPRRSRRIV